MTLFEYDGKHYGVNLRECFDKGGVILLPTGQYLGVRWSGLESYPPPIDELVLLDPKWINPEAAVEPAYFVDPQRFKGEM